MKLYLSSRRNIFPEERNTDTRKIALAFTYGGNINGHVFFEAKLSNETWISCHHPE